ncbi:MAG: hypothetical protein HZB10_00555 [Candidatus Yonathbacteria bacterium]|nr:hypothetical protein [Candidatus Yonathbacteria bacterium]
MESITDLLFLLFLAKVGLISVGIGCLLYLKTRNTIHGFFNGFILTFCVSVFFFLLPTTGGAVALLSILGIMFLALVFFWLAHETSPLLRARLQRELKARGAISPYF